MEMDVPNCPQCERLMERVPRPLNRLVGDVEGFECALCGSMIIEYRFERFIHANSQRSAEAAE